MSSRPPPTRLAPRQATVAVVVAVGVSMLAFQSGRPANETERSPLRRLTDYSEAALQRQLASFDPAMAALARRFDPSGQSRYTPPGGDPAKSGSPAPFASDDLVPMTPAEALRINAAVPISTLPNPPARPFVLAAVSPDEGARALDCLTAAVYYEAGYESPSGKAAVAQVILNRMRHPAFPKSICGVVLQGAERQTGCQFTFTCDGALTRPPEPIAWLKARVVAIAALKGHVEKRVGHATHYHTVWVRPYWSPTLTKVDVVGAHIFYRWNGGWGLSRAFGGRYVGEAGEQIGLDRLYAALKAVGLSQPAPEPQDDAALLLVSSGIPTIPVADAKASSPVSEPSKIAVVLAPPLPPPPSQWIHISGQVVKPGDYPWREGMTFGDAVAAAGGLTPRARVKGAVVMRGSDQQKASLPSNDVVLLAGDKVQVPERYF